MTQEEYKQLIMDVAVAISPKIIELKKETSDITAETVAIYARDIADAVNDILTNNAF